MTRQVTDHVCSPTASPLLQLFLLSGGSHPHPVRWAVIPSVPCLKQTHHWRASLQSSFAASLSSTWHNRSTRSDTASSLSHPVTECHQTRQSSTDCWQHRRPPAGLPAAPAPRQRLLAVRAGRRGQLAVTWSSGSLPACAARRGRMLAYYCIYADTASMQTRQVNTAGRMPESAWGWSILQDERRRPAARTRARAVHRAAGELHG